MQTQVDRAFAEASRRCFLSVAADGRPWTRLCALRLQTGHRSSPERGRGGRGRPAASERDMPK